MTQKQPQNLHSNGSAVTQPPHPAVVPKALRRTIKAWHSPIKKSLSLTEGEAFFYFSSRLVIYRSVQDIRGRVYNPRRAQQSPTTAPLNRS